MQILGTIRSPTAPDARAGSILDTRLQFSHGSAAHCTVRCGFEWDQVILRSHIAIDMPEISEYSNDAVTFSRHVAKSHSDLVD
eukprot:m.116863 g.116863  ORF g.116863 m.116863 type:complete len:83 (+) comp21655_c0_seq1:2492-2740(+)